ncbi:MAG: 2-oxoacid:acceptor oxidoreductase family protein [Eggerthellaceae bacterium]|nr:2-oxoacid:acceptor oxidoreductase family protein [Eggerthellaceae bacterium]
MLNIVLTGVGGQGTVLAAKVLAQAAAEKGWQVRTAETIGMSQRGGSVVSHVRMGNEGEPVFAPLVGHGTAALVIAFEPAEGARCLPYLAPDGVLVSARTALQPVTVALSGKTYDPDAVLARAEESLLPGQRLVRVDDMVLCESAGTRRVLNMVLLAKAIATGAVPLTIDDLCAAVAACVKPKFVDMNVKAIREAVAE